MIRVHVICEGHTEEMFVRQLLAPTMITENIFLAAAKIGRPGHKGGNVNYPRLLFDLRRRLLDDAGCYCTTLLDFYGLPSNFPGKEAAGRFRNTHDKSRCVHDALLKQAGKDLGNAGQRFIPYVQFHEFEALLFSNPARCAKGLRQIALGDHLAAIRNQFDSPEDINDRSISAPSKRIQRLFPGYDKPVHPLLAVREIGLASIRQECRLFNEWLLRIEALKLSSCTQLKENRYAPDMG